MKDICVVSIRVSNMDLARDFYCKRLGFRVAKEYCPEIIRLEHRGATLLLEEAKNVSPASYPQDSQTLIAFRADNLLKEIEELKAKGVEVIYDSPQSCPAGLFTAFKDPFGNVHELLELS